MLQISSIEKINDFEDFDLVESTHSALVAFQTWLQLISKTLASFTYLWLMWAGTGGSIGGSSCRGLRWRHAHPSRCQPNPAQDSTCGNRCTREGPSLWAGLQKKLIRPCLSQTSDRVLGQDRPLPTYAGKGDFERARHLLGASQAWHGVALQTVPTRSIAGR